MFYSQSIQLLYSPPQPSVSFFISETELLLIKRLLRQCNQREDFQVDTMQDIMFLSLCTHEWLQKAAALKRKACNYAR